ncbi:uncharacterized protein LOC143460147 isoform X2 [Clavelina lepadiformis]|uniref:uncharacterized protein LOC143460147 isoform X2 n=1 Tax=Clavelina lepadiformis TaxID=159417 RepID=UPI004043530B
MSRVDNASTRAPSVISKFESCEIEVENTDDVGKPRMGLGSTANENIALRRNYREMEMLWRTQKILGDEQVWVLKLIDLYEKSVQSHLTEEEIIEMENDLKKKEFANKYRMILHNQQHTENENSSNKTKRACPMDVIREDTEEIVKDKVVEASVQKVDSQELSQNINSSQTNTIKQNLTQPIRSQTCQPHSSRINSMSNSNKRRPETSPDLESSEAMSDIIPSLEGLLDQLHNIKPQQFYDNQRKLKLYDIRLLGEELEARKKNFYKTVDRIVNWDKKEPEEKPEEEKEEKPRERKTSFMRSVLRNFSMELMMKTMQYGWADLGQCRYLRNRGGEDDIDPSGVNTLAKDTMKIRLDPEAKAKAETELSSGGAANKQIQPGFDENGKMIRTADLLGLK